MNKGFIARATDKQFYKYFNEPQYLKKFSVVVVSRDIEVKKTYPNLISMTQLVPPNYITSHYINDEDYDKYEHEYRLYLQKYEKMTLINMIVMSVVEKEAKVILMCSEDEKEKGYLKLLCNFIEEVYKLKCFSCKDIRKETTEFKNSSEVKKIMMKITEKLSRITFERHFEGRFKTEEVIEKLEEYSKSDLCSYAKERGIKADEEMKKSKIIKKIIKYYKELDDEEEAD